MVYVHCAAAHEAMFDPNDEGILSLYSAWTGPKTNYTVISAPAAGHKIVLLSAHFCHWGSTNDVEIFFEDGAGGGPEMLCMMSGDDQVPDHWSGRIQFGAGNAVAVSTANCPAGEDCALTLVYKKIRL